MFRIANDTATLKLRSGASKLDPATKCSESSWSIQATNSQTFALEAQARLARACVEACVNTTPPKEMLPGSAAMKVVPDTSKYDNSYDAFIQIERSNKDELDAFIATIVQPWPLLLFRQLLQDYQASILERRVHSSFRHCSIMQPLNRGQLNMYHLVMTAEISNNICKVKCESVLHKYFNFNVRMSETLQDGSASITLGEIQHLTEFLFKGYILPETSEGASPAVSDIDEAREAEGVSEANGISQTSPESEQLAREVGNMSVGSKT